MKLIIVGTLLWGWGYAFEGACLLLNAAEWMAPGSDDLTFHIIMTFDDPIPLLVVFGLIFLLLGITALLAALGLKRRKPRGTILVRIVSLLAIALGLRSLNIGPEIVYDASSSSLGVAQLVYGIPTLVIMSWNREELRGVFIFRLLNLLVGLPALLCSAMFLDDVLPRIFHHEVDTTDFLKLTALAGVVASLFLVLSGAFLFNSQGKGRAIALGLMIAAASTAAVMAALALVGALRGQSREGLREAYLLIVFFPAALVLLALSASGAWYLLRPQLRPFSEA